MQVIEAEWDGACALATEMPLEFVTGLFELKSCFQ